MRLPSFAHGAYIRPQQQVFKHERQNRDAGIVWYCALCANHFLPNLFYFLVWGISSQHWLFYTRMIYRSCVSALLYISKIVFRCAGFGKPIPPIQCIKFFSCLHLHKERVACLLEFEEFLGVRFATRPKDYSSEFGSAVLGSYCFCSVCSKVLLQCQGLVRSLGALYDNVSSRVSCR